MWTRLLTSLLFFVTVSAQAVTETIEMVQVTPTAQLETTVFKPDGPGPFPLVVINHGKDLGAPSTQARARYTVISKEFLKRGYAVILPMRQAFSKSTGDWGYIDCDMPATGILQANDIELTLNEFTKRSWVDKDRILIVGQSFGGLTALAFSARNYPGVKGTINFAGGLKIFWGCQTWKESLVQAAAEYGFTALTPSLWFYIKGDTLFDQALAKQMYRAYIANGADATLVTTFKYPYKADPHTMIGWSDGPDYWWSDIEIFLKKLGLPFENLNLSEPMPK